MKTTVATIISLACVAVQALPVPQDRGTINAGIYDAVGSANSLISGLTKDSGKLLGSLSLEDIAAATYERSLAEYLISSASADVKNALEANGIDADDERLDRLLEEAEGKDINELIGDISNTLGARSLDEECEDATDFSDGKGTADDSEPEDDSTAEGSSGAVDDENVPSDDSDIGSLVDDSSLTANDVENGVSAEGGDQIDLSRRTILPSADGLITGLGHAIITTGEGLNIDLSKIEAIAAA